MHTYWTKSIRIASANSGDQFSSTGKLLSGNSHLLERQHRQSKCHHLCSPILLLISALICADAGPLCTLWSVSVSQLDWRKNMGRLMLSFVFMLCIEITKHISVTLVLCHNVMHWKLSSSETKTFFCAIISCNKAWYAA